jgi:hypothetical protein
MPSAMSGADASQRDAEAPNLTVYSIPLVNTYKVNIALEELG